MALFTQSAASAQRVPPIPSATALTSARGTAAQGPGRVDWAVVDTRGRLFARNGSSHHRAASITKAMLLVAYLRRRRHHPLPPTVQRILRPMIYVSGNKAASRVHDLVGDAGLADVGRAARMRDLRLNGTWSEAEVTAADQARLFSRIDRITPRRRRAYAWGLLGGIVRRQSWGIPAVARRKGIVNQAALLEAPDGRRLSLAVLTDGQPRFATGRAAIERLTRRFLPDG